MIKVRSGFAAVQFFSRFFLSRLKLAQPPLIDPYIEECTDIVGTILHVPDRTRIIGSEKVPREGPLIVACNHLKLDDPCQVYHAVRMATGRMARIMMRDDYFAGPFFESRLFNAVAFFKCIGAYPISRDSVSFAQIKPFVNLLEAGEAFVIFPGRSRTRSGLIIEYSDTFTEPGGISLFVRQAQRHDASLRVATLPVARNYNPVTQTTSVIFGEALYLDSTADKQTTRGFDARVIESIARLTEVGIPHILAAVFFFRALHHRTGPIHEYALREIIRDTYHFAQHDHFEQLPPRGQIPEAVHHALTYFANHRMIRVQDARIYVNVPEVMAIPPLDREYRDKNPVRFLCNRIVHLSDVIRIVEERSLRYGYDSKDSPEYASFVQSLEHKLAQDPRPGYYTVAMRKIQDGQESLDALNALCDSLARGSASLAEWNAYSVPRADARGHLMKVLAGGDQVGRTRDDISRHVAEKYAQSFEEQFSADALCFRALPECDPDYIFSHGMAMADSDQVGLLWVEELD